MQPSMCVLFNIDQLHVFQNACCMDSHGHGFHGQHACMQVVNEYLLMQTVNSDSVKCTPELSPTLLAFACSREDSFANDALGYEDLPIFTAWSNECPDRGLINL